jgi:hypothetical protein
MSGTAKSNVINILAVLKTLVLLCSSLLPQKAITAMRELLDTGVDFG